MILASMKETEQEQLEEQRSRLDDHNRLLIDPDDDEDGPGDEEILTQSEAAKLLNRSAFISIRTNQWLKGKSRHDVIISINNENSRDIKPEFVISKFNFYQIIFSCPDQRDKAVESKLTIFNKTTNLEMPRPRTNTRVRTLHISNVPITIPHEEVKKWLQANVKTIKFISDFKWVEVEDTGIKTGVRSIVVEVHQKFQFPGFAWYKTPGMQTQVKVKIWHQGMPQWCRKCMAPGHMAVECDIVDNQPPRGSYAAALMARPGSKEPRSGGAPVEMVMTRLVDAGDQEPGPKNPDTDKVAYKSTEHYLFHQKAMAMGDKEAAQIILNAPNAVEAKKIGGKLPWDFTKLGTWHNFAYSTLYKANGYKYEQDSNLRRQFFNTAPALLVEANPYDLYWGCGLKRDDPSINDLRSYP
uniref:NADAR domain-containing protein n=1 Tax=Romanomermis culicivorax TaxID=13658 RepID=A0A915JBA8_ROMCU